MLHFSFLLSLYGWLAVQPPGVADPENYLFTVKEGWRFTLAAAEGAQQTAFDDSAWPQVWVPNNAQDISQEPPRSTRKVWFRNRFRLPRPAGLQSVVLEVAGVRLCEVWLNGERLGQTEPGEFRFVREVSSLLREGDNVLALRTAVPGILDGVRLFVRGPLYLDPRGLLVDTPGWQGGPGRVRVRTRLHARPEGSDLRLEAAVYDHQNRPLSRTQTVWKATGAAGSPHPVELTLGPIEDPPHWSPDSPRLCRLRLELFEGSRLLQRDEAEFGFRWFSFDPESGFQLNGKALKLRGTVYTKTAPRQLFQSRQELWEHEIVLLKGMGLNFIRPAEGGICDEFFEIADRYGLLSIVQVLRLQEGTDPGDQLRNVREDVEQFYNHPSLIAWQFNGEGKDAATARLQSQAAAELRRLDPTRSVLCVELGWRSPGTVGLTDADVAGQGNYTGWYEGTLDHIGPYLDEYRELLRERYGRYLPVIVSNYGAAADSEVRTDHPRRNDYSHDYHTDFHQRFEKEIALRRWLAGGLIFVFRDIQSAQPIPRHTWKGVIDLQERRRDAYYYYQSRWASQPMVHIVQKSWTPREVWPQGSARRIEVFTNAQSVELFHNGRSLGRRPAPDPAWDVRFEEGRNELKAVAGGSRPVEDLALIDIRFRPPAVEPRLVSEKGGPLTLRWNAIPGADSYAVYGSAGPGVSLQGDPVEVSTTSYPLSNSAWRHFRVVARAGDRPGLPSAEVGTAAGALRWRFPNSGWLLSSPALSDLDGDGRLDIVIGSYNGSLYAVGPGGDLLWELEAGGTVLSSPAIDVLRPGDSPSIAVNSSHALYLVSAKGKILWTYEDVRHFDRSVKSPAIGDLDGDGVKEILVGSDRGELLCLDVSGKLRWKYETDGRANRGLSLTTPMVLSTPASEARVLFSADDGLVYLLDGRGRLVWKFDSRVGDRLPGLVPNMLSLAAGPLEPGGPLRILVGVSHLRALDLEGRVVWERPDLSGPAHILELQRGGNRHVSVAAGRVLHVLDSRGQDVWTFNLDHPRDFFGQPPISADLDEDGRPDLLIGTRATHLYALNHEGRLLWKFATDDELSGTAAVADLDGDGRLEVILGSRDGYLYLIGAGASPASALSSLQYKGGPERTGNYSR